MFKATEETVVCLCPHANQPFCMVSEVVAQWCTQGDLLAVAGMEQQPQLSELPNGPLLKSAMVKFYNIRGEHIFTLDTLVQVRTLENTCCYGPSLVNNQELVIVVTFGKLYFNLFFLNWFMTYELGK